MAFLQVKQVSKQYSDEHRGLTELNVTVEQHKRIALIGETGSGKSTLFKLMAGLLSPDKGEIMFHNKKVLSPEEKLIPGHDQIAYLPQDNKLPRFVTVRDYLFDKYEMSEHEAETVYEACKIQSLLDKQTDECSGGEKQRVALAKKLLVKPELLLLDEPFSSLDFIHKTLMKETLNDIQKQLGTSIMLIAHDGPDVLGWADDIWVMQSGKIIQTGSPKQIYYRPASVYVAGLTGRINQLNSAIWDVPDKTAFVNCQGKLLVRPELLVPVRNGVKGVVRHAIFNGSFTDYEIETSDAHYTMRSLANAHAVGDKIEMGIVLP